MKTAPSAPLPRGCATFQVQPGDLKMRAGSSVVSIFLQSDNQSGQVYPFRLLLKDYYCRRGAEGRNPTVREGVTQDRTSRRRLDLFPASAPSLTVGFLPSALCFLLSVFCGDYPLEALNCQSSCETGRTF